ncbi:DUF2255 family protein [Asanoa sp. WMMD1127]|uniref:DUF2255 family protein n=1 Tax=Asanoa sp. WMMD1127 TaxID=3016107 RepID=UPI0024179507|nr:DUF2255 family protein [Asanoa sp. WMMD1127]MDG4824758.1 DUF2255 family protein [Asanoa sp. WMMD1127]
MTAGWSADDLRLIDASAELRIAVRGVDGSLRRAVPIWVVTTGGRVYVRSWHRRDTGWFGRAVRSGRARISVPGLAADVTVTDLGDTSADVTAAVDAAYRTKYGGGADSMVTPTAATTTLRLDRA